MRNNLRLIGILFFALGPLSVLACDFSHPHSLSCQHEAFQGKIFPLMPLNFSLLDESWVPAQFTAATSSSPFLTLTARSGRQRTCAVINQDRSRVGVMNFRLSRNRIKSVAIAQFGSARRNFKSRSQVSFEDEKSVIFGNGAEAFRCRIFERVGIAHLTCQYFVNGKFIGYLGLLPSAISCR